jgi:hypothetical protein
MQAKSTADARASLGSVHGLGVCDALRLRLRPVQVPWLIDELEELRGPFEERLQRLRAEAASSGDARTREALRAAEYELQLLRMMRAQLPGSQEEPVSFVGPSAMVLDVVLSTLRSVVDRLAELAGERVCDERAGARLGEAAAAAQAWVETFLDCQAVAAFSFDPDVDPVGTR